MSDDLIRRRDAIRAFTFNSKGERIPFVDCDNFPVEFPLRYIVDTLVALPAADRPQEWIPCSERLPDEDGEYLVTQKNGSIGRYVFNYDGNSEEYFKRCATAWMPMPAAYVKED